MASAVAMPRLFLGVLVCLAGGLAWQQGAAAESMPRPSDGAVAGGAYANKYFDVSYPLPSGWTEGLAGPDPSSSGYYVLSTLVPGGDFTGMILIAAQDLFFASKPFSDAAEMAQDLRKAKSELDGVTIDGEPAAVPIAGRSFSRVDNSGFGLFETTFIAHIRCHLVTFGITANSAEHRAELAQSIHKMVDAGGGAKSDPPCIKNYARQENVVARVNPVPVAPLTTPIPVRIIVAADGSVKHVHAIYATADQRTSIENALRQWKLKPHAVDGRAVEIETGVIIQFAPDGSVRYPTGDRQPPG